MMSSNNIKPTISKISTNIIFDIIDKNPYKNHIIDKLEENLIKDVKWDIFNIKPLEPPGPLSMGLIHTDPLYLFGNDTFRKQYLRESITKFQNNTDVLSKFRHKKKIQDLLSASDAFQDKIPNPLLDNVICSALSLQKVIINKRKKVISFSPPDIRCWKSNDVKIIFSDDENRWIYTLPDDYSLNLISWITSKEEEGWNITWPTVSNTIKASDLFAELTKRNLSIYDSKLKKLKKEDMSRIIGRAESIELLSLVH